MRTSSLETQLRQISRHLFATPNDRLIAHGITCFTNRQFDEALESLLTAIENGTDDPRPYAYIAFISAENGKEQEANIFLDKALELAPGQLEFQAALGEIYLRTGNPGSATYHLRAALQAQPDLYGAYPALGEAYRQQNQHALAAQILESVASIPSLAQANIQNQLIEILAEQGNCEALMRICLKNTENLATHSIATRLLMLLSDDLSEINNAIEWQAKHYSSPRSQNLALHPPGEPVRLAFLVSDFNREAGSGRLEAFLLGLPPSEFITIIFDNSPDSLINPFAQRIALIADHWLSVGGLDDQRAQDQMSSFNPEIIIDLDGHGPNQRLSLLTTYPSAGKFSPALPHPSLLAPQLSCPASIAGIQSSWPVTRFHTAHYPQLPTDKRPNALAFGCLTPANMIGEHSWRLFAQVLQQNHATTLTINLGKLGEAGQRFIEDCFASCGIERDRLRFLHLATPEEYCKAWRNITVGLGGSPANIDMATLSALWMNTPLITRNFTSYTPPVVQLLSSLKQDSWIAASPDDFVSCATTHLLSPTPVRLRDMVIEEWTASPEVLTSELAQQLSLALGGTA